MRHLLTVADLKPAEIERIFAITEDLKTKFEQGLREAILPGRVMALLFEKPSMRTRVSFEAAMGHLGGSSLFLGSDVGWGSRESLTDFSRVLGQYVDVVVTRAGRHETIVELAQYAGCPVINGLTDYAHPCQALSDIYTLRELVGSLQGRTLAYVGDGNNVARCLAMACGKVGMRFVAAMPQGYRFDPAYAETLKREAPGLELTITDDPVEAVREATAVYTDVWASMGQESESEVRRKAFAAFQVNQRLMRAAPRNAYFMHCMPRHRNEEVSDEVFDSRQSIVVQQAGNRMHVQKGILAWLLGSQA